MGEHSFRTVWLILTAVALISTAFLVGRPTNPTASGSDASHAAGPGRSRAVLATFALSLLFLTGYTAVILVGEDFTAYDNAQFTTYSLRGIDFPNPIWKESGRFFPLGLQQFNLLGRVTRSLAGYHAFAIAEILILFSILLALDRALNISARAALAAVVLMLPSVLQAFLGLIYQECDVVFWLACMALSVEFFARARSVWWALAAVLSAQFALYYKEPVFLFLLAFTGFRMFLRGRHSGSVYAAFRDAETRLDLAIAALSLAFLAYYAIAILPNFHPGYLAEHQVSRLQTARAYLRSDLLIWVFAAFTLARFYRLVRGTAGPALLWDGMACGALAYFAAYLALGMVSEYYLAPADLIAALYLGRFLLLSWDRMRIRSRVVCAAAAVIVVGQILDSATLCVVGRKYVIQRKASVANLIIAMRAHDPGRVTRLDFPLTPPLGVAEFAAYLSYRGVPVEELGHAYSDGAGVEFYSARMSQTGRCVPFHDFVCHAGAAPDGDLAVVFPDDVYPQCEHRLHYELEQKLLARVPQSRARVFFFRSLDFIWSYADRLRPH